MKKGIFENKCLVFGFVMVRRTMKSAWYQQLSIVMETSWSGAESLILEAGVIY